MTLRLPAIIADIFVAFLGQIPNDIGPELSKNLDLSKNMPDPENEK
jgi:hypothetical protein